MNEKVSPDEEICIYLNYSIIGYYRTKQGILHTYQVDQ
jgi:hypothetical protein